MALVSVITPVQNGSSYFDRAIPSILAQKDVDFEWIIVDDHSTDSTLSDLRDLSMRDKRIKVFSLHEQGLKGHSVALNFAVRQSSGEFIAVQDFDDTSVSTRLSIQASLLGSDPSLGLVGGWTNHVYPSDPKRNHVLKCPSSHHEICALAAKRIPFCHTVSMFRKSAWQKCGGYREDIRTILDLNFWVDLVAAEYQIACVQNILGDHFIYPQSRHASLFNQNWRQRQLAKAQLKMANVAQLPNSAKFFPVSRILASFLPGSMSAILKDLLIKSATKNG